MAKSEWELRGQELRWLHCPQCAGEIERDRCMCGWCGAVVYPATRGDMLRLEGVVCFSCGYGNPGSERRQACGECGKPFSVLCPGCATPVSLAHRCCVSCGMSVEEFDTERTRREVADRQERRDQERALFAFFRWQVVVGMALMALGLLIGRSEVDLRRRVVGGGALTGALGALPLGFARAAGSRFRRREL
jgi:hypothetical protein